VASILTSILNWVFRPLPGLRNVLLLLIAGLTPGATFCRRLRRLIDAGIRLADLNASWSRLLLFSFFLFPFAFASAQDYSKFLHSTQKHAPQSLHRLSPRTIYDAQHSDVLNLSPERQRQRPAAQGFSSQLQRKFQR
jgi:hypothetical protein